MRGVSNAISAIFAVAIILSVTYTAVSATIQYSAKVANAAKAALIHIREEGLAEYNKFAEYNTSDGIITVRYGGSVPEYGVRLFCYDISNPTSGCLVPTKDGANSVSYVDPFQGATIDAYVALEYNLLSCSNGTDLDAAAKTNKLACAVMGTLRAQKMLILTR